MRSETTALAFLGIESSLERPTVPPPRPCESPWPASHILGVDTFKFANSQNVKLSRGESAPIPYPPSSRPVARIIVCLLGPLLREIGIRSGSLNPVLIDEREEHGQRVGGVAVLHHEDGKTIEGPATILENKTADAWEGVVVDIFGKL